MWKSTNKLIVEYFYETQDFIAGCKTDGNIVYLTEFSNSISLVRTYDTYNTENMFQQLKKKRLMTGVWCIFVLFL